MWRLMLWVLLLGCILVLPALAEDPAKPGTTAVEGTAVSVEVAPPGLTLVSTTPVTPTGDFLHGDFVRIFRKGTKVVVTFSTTLSSALVPGACPKTDPQLASYVYREFNEDMTPTGKQGVIACNVIGDNGGLLFGDRFYLALSGVGDPLLDGWKLSMYDANSWTTLPAPPASPLVGPFSYILDCGKIAGDPMLTYVNGQIDIDGKYYGPGCCGDSKPPYCQPGPTYSYTTHHNFFDPTTFNVAPCPPSCPLILPVPPNPGHIEANSVIVKDGYINFLASSSLLGDMLLMRFDSTWNYVSSSILRPRAWCPEGVAYFGGYYYVSFLDSTNCDAGKWGCEMNARLAVFNQMWGVPPVEEVALTSFGKGSKMDAQKPTILLIDDKLYVAYISGPLGVVGVTQVSVALLHLEPAHWPIYLPLTLR